MKQSLYFLNLPPLYRISRILPQKNLKKTKKSVY